MIYKDTELGALFLWFAERTLKQIIRPKYVMLLGLAMIYCVHRVLLESGIGIVNRDENDVEKAEKNVQI